jgi:hypothetical protein
MKIRLVLFALLLGAVLAVSSCGNMLDSDTVHSRLTAHQRDSVLAKSVLPGAGVVDRALKESERSAVRAASMDARIDSLSR